MANQSLLFRMLNALKQTTVEPFMFLTMFPYAVFLVTLQNLLMERSCRLLLNYSEAVCNNLDAEENSNELSGSVQYGNNLYVGMVMMSTIPAVIVATFLGPWSDKYSRKYPLIISTVGVLLEMTTNLILSALPNASPYWFLASSALSGVCGGFIMVLSAIFSYISDVTDEKTRPTRYAILEFASIISVPLGTLVGGQVYSASGYVAVMAICPCSVALGLVWAIFLVKETKPPIAGLTKRQMFRDLFRLDNVRSSFETCLKPRPGNMRLQIWLLVLVNCTIRIVDMGTLGIGYAYTKVSFGWTVTKYSNGWTIFGLLDSAITLIMVPILNKTLQLHEAAVGAIGILSLMAKQVLMSVAFKEGIVYFSWFAGCMYAFGGIAVRSRLSKLVSKQELGRAFSLLATCEALTPVIGTVTMTQILNNSLDFYPGLPFAVGAILLLQSAAVFFWMMKLPTMSFAEFQEKEDLSSMKELDNINKGNVINVSSSCK